VEVSEEVMEVEEEIVLKLTEAIYRAQKLGPY